MTSGSPSRIGQTSRPAQSDVVERLVAVFWRVYCKTWEYFLHLLTRLRCRCDDPTKLLLANTTALQSEASKNFRSITVKLNSAQNSRDLGLQPKVSVFIPFRDKWDLTAKCLRSLAMQKIEGFKVSVCLIDNGSVEAQTAKGISSLAGNPWWQSAIGVEVLRLDCDFNFSFINNSAFMRQFPKGGELNAGQGNDTDCSEYILFLNNDVELVQKDSLESMVGFMAKNPKVGALGCTLLYPDHRIQHLFLAPGVKLGGAHPLRGQIFSPSWEWFKEPRPVAAVTGAAFMVRQATFAAAGMFDENLGTAYQDLDLCLKLQKLGYCNWVLPEVTMIHQETATRPAIASRTELEYLYRKWGTHLTNNPYFSSRFSRWSEQPALALGESDYPWQRVVVSS